MKPAMLLLVQRLYLKMRCTVLLVIFLLHLPPVLFGQERGNNNNTFDIDTTDFRLTKARGWQYVERAGEWLSLDNEIHDRVSYNGLNSFAFQNFYFIKSFKIRYNDTQYYALIYRYLTGAFKYPAIQEDWQQYDKVGYIIFDSLQWQSLKKAALSGDTSTVSIKLDLVSSTKSPLRKVGVDYNNPEARDYLAERGLPDFIYMPSCIAELQRLLKVGTSDYQCIYINSQSSVGKEVVRFLLPTYCHTGENLRQRYFQVDKAEFMKLFF